MDLDRPTQALLEASSEDIEASLRNVLAFDPGAPACVGVVVSDGKVGVAKATTLAGYRRAPVPEAGQPERALYDALGAALRIASAPGREHVVLAEHRSASTVVVVRTLSIETDVRTVMKSALGEPRTPDERLVEELVRTMPAPEDVGTTLDDCVAAADQQVEWFEKVVHSVQASGLSSRGISVSVHGREVLRWWRDGTRRGPAALRQRVLLVALLRAGRVDDALWLRDFAEAARHLVWPMPTAARSTEVLAMSAAIIQAAARRRGTFDDTDTFFGRHAASDHLIEPSYKAIEAAGLSDDRNLLAMSFLSKWEQSAFARLEVSHKLAAALCLTDVGANVELHSPWEAWSLLLPDGLLGDSQPARLWCVGAEPLHVVTTTGQVRPCDAANVGGALALEMLQALVRAVCVVLSDPDRRKAEGRWGGTTAASMARGKRAPERPVDGARYVLAQPVTIDLRETVREALAGRHSGGGGIPKHQFLVRGHPRQQAWGPNHTLRRYKWIEPYWKGDPQARILLRGHRVEDGDDADKTRP